MKIENSIHIAASPEKVFAFFENMETNYLKWHPDHRNYKSVKGKGMAAGNVFLLMNSIIF